MKILITIANYGTLNDGYLNQLLSIYRALPHEVDIVVLTNIAKNLGSNIEVRVGLPTRDPKSLPFAHKQVFAERQNDYDLFIYCEDDTPVSERNIQAFLDAAAVLQEKEIAGFLRTEVGPDGKEYFPDAYGFWHWDPASARQRGKMTFAYFNNEHAACYILTRGQLKAAIQSGGFLEGPHQGKYKTLESAATDVYTQCGFTKLVCISNIDDFLVPHLANKYFSLAGTEFRRQLPALMAISRGERSSQELVETTKLPLLKSSKSYFEPLNSEVLGLVPKETKNVLSVGCGWGALEGELINRGVGVVGVPLDSVIALCAEARRVVTVKPNLKGARKELAGQSFDCMLILNLLHLLRDPLPVLASYVELLSPGGTLIVTVPNFKYAKMTWWGIRGVPGYKDLGSFDKTGVYSTTHRGVCNWLEQCGLSADSTVNAVPERLRSLPGMPWDFAAPFLAPEFTVRARKQRAGKAIMTRESLPRNAQPITDGVAVSQG